MIDEVIDAVIVAVIDAVIEAVVDAVIDAVIEAVIEGVVDAVVDAVIRLAHALDFIVVAEGVETDAQRKALTELNCDQMQGYLFSRPMPEDKLVILMKKLGTNFESTGQFVIADYQKTQP